MNKHNVELSTTDLDNVSGGIVPLMPAIALAAVGVASFAAGYKMGEDLAKRRRSAQSALEYMMEFDGA